MRSSAFLIMRRSFLPPHRFMWLWMGRRKVYGSTTEFEPVDIRSCSDVMGASKFKSCLGWLHSSANFVKSRSSNRSHRSFVIRTATILKQTFRYCLSFSTVHTWSKKVYKYYISSSSNGVLQINEMEVQCVVL